MFVSFDAKVLGHSGLVTTDIPAAAGFLAASYYALRFVARPTWGRAVAAGGVLGLAVSCKFTCVLLAPAVVILIGVRGCGRRSGASRGRSSSGRLWRVPKVRYFVAITVVAFVTLWATYLFNVGRLEDQHLFARREDVGEDSAGGEGRDDPDAGDAAGVHVHGGDREDGVSVLLQRGAGSAGAPGVLPGGMAIKRPMGLVVALVLAMWLFVVSRRRRRRC